MRPTLVEQVLATVCILGTTTVQADTYALTPTLDTYTSQASPDTSFSGSTSLNVDGSKTSTKWAFLKFDLTFSHACQMSSATLRISGRTVGGGMNLGVSANRVDDTSWTASV